jgi:hypothetical protein
MSSAAEERPSTLCAHCQKPAKLFCSACSDAPSPHTQKRYYCSETCQKSDRENHKTECKHLQALKELYRAGDLLQDVFYMYKERTFATIFTKIEKKDGKLVFSEEEQMPKVSQVDYLHPFPEMDVIPEMKDRRALLTYLAGPDAVGYMHDVIAHYLQREDLSYQQILLIEC